MEGLAHFPAGEDKNDIRYDGFSYYISFMSLVCDLH